jgi:hypothetical protein
MPVPWSHSSLFSESRLAVGAVCGAVAMGRPIRISPYRKNWRLSVAWLTGAERLAGKSDGYYQERPLVASMSA